MQMNEKENKVQIKTIILPQHGPSVHVHYSILYIGGLPVNVTTSWANNYLNIFKRFRHFVLKKILLRTGGQADRRTSGHADMRTCGHADMRTCGHADNRTGGQADRRTGGQADGRTGGRTGGPCMLA